MVATEILELRAVLEHVVDGREQPLEHVSKNSSRDEGRARCSSGNAMNLWRAWAEPHDMILRPQDVRFCERVASRNADLSRNRDDDAGRSPPSSPYTGAGNAYSEMVGSARDSVAWRYSPTKCRC
jgi:hypothetical protein